MKTVFADLHYFPNLEYFCAILDSDKLVLDPQSIYQRKSFYNRTQIRLANKVETLSVPIVGRRPRIPLGEIEIDYRQKWQKVHLRGIQSAYGKTPFFEFIFPYFEALFEQEYKLLWDMNLQVLTICLKIMQWPVNLEIASESANKQEYPDVRGLLVPGTPFTERDFYQPVEYVQNFGLDFEPNLSILDLLFAEGPQAKSILQASSKKH